MPPPSRWSRHCGGKQAVGDRQPLEYDMVSVSTLNTVLELPPLTVIWPPPAMVMVPAPRGVQVNHALTQRDRLPVGLGS